LTMLNYKTS